MSTTLPDAPVATGLSRSQAAQRAQDTRVDRGKVDPALEKAARQFEALFLERMLSAMRSSVPESGIFPKGTGSQMYEHLMDSSVAEHMTRGRGVGIADFLYREWTGERIPGGAAVALAGAMTPAASPPGMRPESAFDEQGVPVLNLPGTVDDGSRPLREMLPPTGLEERSSSSPANVDPGDFSLNDAWHGPDSTLREPSLVRGSSHERENNTTTSNDGAAPPGRGTSQGQHADHSAACRARDAYRQHAGVEGGHTGHARGRGAGTA